MQAHPFDQAIALASAGADMFAGHTSPGYWNMIGPFGGISAAIAMNAVMQHPARLGEPVSLTINYASVLVPGPFTVLARAARTNRSTQHWMIEVMQPDAAGAPETVLTATAVTAVRRDTWSANDMPMPDVLLPQETPRQNITNSLEWLKRYEIRLLEGKMPKQFDGTVRQQDPATDSLTRLWIRDDPVRGLDFCSLAALADAFYPRLYLRRASRVPVGTVSMTVYFHTRGAELAALGDSYVLAQARGQVFRNGFFDQNAQLWSASGTLLVTSLQIVYYKE